MGRMVEREHQERRSVWQSVANWRHVGPLLALAGTLGIAIVGAIITGNEVGVVVGGVEGLSADSGNFLGRLATFFPFGFAFSAGMAASVNPCGFVMLPAYLGLYLGDSSGETAEPNAAARLQHAVRVGGTVTLGFVLMFALVGVPVGLGALVIVDVFPWVGFAIGLVLVAAGTYMLYGGKIYSNWAAKFSSKVGGGGNSVRGYLTFGIAYGIASLSCTLPIFLAVVGGAFTSATFLDSVLQFLLYGLGMGSVILALTIGMAVFRGAMVGALRRMLPHFGTISAVLLLVAGSFIVYYWLTIGQLLDGA